MDGWDGMDGYLQTSPFLDHLAVIITVALDHPVSLKYFGGLRNLSSPLDVGIMTLKIVVVVFCTREDSNVPLCRAQAGREARLAIDRNLPQKLSQNIEKKS